MANENARRFSLRTLSTIGKDALTVNGIAASTGVAPTMVAAPIAREMSKTDAGDYEHNALVEYIKNRVVNSQPHVGYGRGAGRIPITNGYLAADRDTVRRENIRNNDSGKFGWLWNNKARAEHPTLNDIGPGKIQIGTAVDLVQKYAADPRFSEFGLSQYLGHYDQLVHDMQDPATARRLAYTLQALVGSQATNFFIDKLGKGNSEAGLRGWNGYSDQEKAALVTAYSAIGEESLRQRADRQIAERGFYAPDAFNSDGAAYLNYGDNYDALKYALRPEASAPSSISDGASGPPQQQGLTSADRGSPIQDVGRRPVDGSFGSSGAAGGPAWPEGGGAGPGGLSGPAASPVPNWPGVQGAPIPKVPSYEQYMKLLGMDSPTPDASTPGPPFAPPPSPSGADGGWFARMMADADPDDPTQFRPQPWTLQRRS